MKLIRHFSLSKAIFLINVFFLQALNAKAQDNFAKYVNPFIGTGGHGHTYPGATLPHGMVQLSPDTRLEGWDGCGGYHYSDSFIYGFSHTHLSGTGVSDYGDILLMPMTGKPSPDNKVYGSVFSHRNEQATSGYYNVLLQDDKIFTEFTATERTGYHHYNFSSLKDNYVILDLKHRDEVIASSIQIVDSVTVTGMRRSKAWADNQYVFFVIKFSRPFSKSGIWLDEQLQSDEIKKAEDAKNLKAYFQIDSELSKDIYLQVAISPVSIEGAIKNLEAEALGKSFETVKTQATEKWNRELGKISVKSTDTSRLRIFYTALYHTAIVPNLNMDVDGAYRGRDNKIHQAEGFDYYSVFSLWDTYRATHPLYTIIDRKRTLDYIKTFLVQYQQGGRLPVWELASCETDCMIGYHSVSVIADAYAKGINEFDTMLALEAMKKSAQWSHYGLPGYISRGQINTEDDHESVSKTLEYAYDDYCIANYAKAMGDTIAWKEFSARAQYYWNVLDSRSGFVRPRKNGDWLSPFDPREVNNHFTEANSWQYSFAMPHDVNGYMKIAGGPKKLEQKLDALFSANSKTTGRDQSDITGLIGQYAHGNEPSHHIIYLYNFCNRADKTQRLVNKVMTEMYKDAPDGLIGNEDCGQMSAWYIMSALGFYPVVPGSDKYMIGSPLFDLADIQLENGKSFIINAPGAGNGNIYIREALLSTTASLRPKKWTNAYINHEDIAGGGLVTLMMNKQPVNFFTAAYNQSASTDKNRIIPNPVIRGGIVPFHGAKTVAITCDYKNALIYYTVDGTTPDSTKSRYRSPIVVSQSLQLKAIAYDGKGKQSFITTAAYKKIPHNWSVKLNTAYEPQYNGNGNDGLIDGIRGTTNWRMGNWQGYQMVNPDVVIDLKAIKNISTVRAGFLQETRSWIIMPSEVTVEVSSDGKQFSQVYKGSNFIDIKDLTPQLKTVEAKFNTTKARYVRIRAVQYGKMPSWHEGAGGDTHIFMDEVEIE